MNENNFVQLSEKMINLGNFSSVKRGERWQRTITTRIPEYNYEIIFTIKKSVVEEAIMYWNDKETRDEDYKIIKEAMINKIVAE